MSGVGTTQGTLYDYSSKYDEFRKGDDHGVTYEGRPVFLSGIVNLEVLEITDNLSVTQSVINRGKITTSLTPGPFSSGLGSMTFRRDGSSHHLGVVLGSKDLGQDPTRRGLGHD